MYRTLKEGWLNTLNKSLDFKLWEHLQLQIGVRLASISQKYLNNTLPTRKNLCLSGPYLKGLHAVLPPVRDLTTRGIYLQVISRWGKCTSCHNSVLLFLANAFSSSLKKCTVYADLPSFMFPCLISVLYYIIFLNALYTAKYLRGVLL